MLAAVLAAVFVVATAVVGYTVNHHDKNSSSATAVSPAEVTGDVPSSGTSGLPSVGTVPSGGVASPSSSAAVVPAPVTSRPPMLDAAAVRRTLQTYFNALLYHDLSALKDATCPKFRYSEKGTYINGNAVRSYRAHSYTILPDLSYVTVVVTLRFRDENTGANAGSKTEIYYVKKVPSGSYYVCGVER